MPIQSILVPYDFSETSALALELAAELAARCGAALELLHVHVVAGAGSAADDLAFARRGLDAARVRALALGAPLVTVRVVNGHPVAEIVRATRAGVDLVVIGSNGSTGLDRLMLGSVARKIVDAVPCPVLTVPPRRLPS